MPLFGDFFRGWPVADELIVIQKTYDLIAWAVPAIGKFPRSHRFVLGERMETALRINFSRETAPGNG